MRIWSRVVFFGVITAAGLLISCGDDSSSAADVTAAKNKEGLPSCTDQKEEDEPSSSSVVQSRSSSSSGDKVSSGEDKGTSSSNGKSESSSSFVGNSSSSGASSSSSSETVVSSSENVDECPVDENAEGAKLTGYIQLAGFAEGTCVSLKPMNEKMEYVDSSVVYRGKVGAKNGIFSFYGLPNDLDIVEIKVKGNGFLNGDSNTLTEMSIHAVARLKTDGPVFMNALTEGIYGRLNYLIKQKGMSFDEAKTKAESEYLEMFAVETDFHDFEKMSIFDNTNESYWMWAISSLIGRRGMLDYRSHYPALLSKFKVEGPDVTFPPAFIYDYSSNGPTAKGEFLSWGSARWELADTMKVRQWKIFTHASGMEKCTPERKGEVFKVQAQGYSFSMHYYCDMEGWRAATNMEKDTYGWERPCLANEMRQGDVTTDGYFCTGAGIWVDATSLNGVVPRYYMLNPGIEYGSMTDERNGYTYKTIVINGKTWMAENLSISEATIQKLGDEDLIANVKAHIHSMPHDTLHRTSQCGLYYSWSAYMNLPDSVASKGSAADAAALIKENHQGICPEGWHIPSETEMEMIIPGKDGEKNTSVGSYLKSIYGWGRVFTDSYGFSLLPCGKTYLKSGIWTQGDVGDRAYVAASIPSNRLRYYGIYSNDSKMYRNEEYGSSANSVAMSVRCVKND